MIDLTPMGSAFLFLAIFCLSCKAQKETANGENRASDPILTLVLCDDYGGFTEKGASVIENNKELKTAFAVINRTRKPGIPVPEIDFEKDMAILVNGGEVRSGNRISLTLEVEDKDTLEFGIKSEKDYSKKDTSAIVQPFCLYTFPKTEKNIIFSIRTF